jgi:hypothetical protein
MIKGTFYPIAAEDLINGSAQRLATMLTDIWDRNFGKGGTDRHALVITSTGHWFHQDAWTDTTGYYLRFRIAPLDLGREFIRDAARRVVREFATAFEAIACEYDTAGIDKGEEVTVVAVTGRRSIGD